MRWSTETRGEERRERILRRSVEVYREESKGSEVNWINALWFPERTVFSTTGQRLPRVKLTQWTRRMS